MDSHRHNREPDGIVRLLRKAASFAQIPKPDLRRIAASSIVESALAGETLFAQGDAGSWAYLVLDGELAVEVEDDTELVTVAVIGPGELVGEIAAFAATPRTATVRARSESRLLRIEQAVVTRYLAARPETAMAIIADLGRRLQNQNSTLATLTHAANALAAGSFEPSMLDSLRSQATRFAHFADVFERMASELLSKRALALEMRTAAEIQSAMLPDGAASHPLPGLSLAAAMVPARQVGGDFYDHFALDDRRLAIAVGDVSGKGVPAALFMAIARTVLRTVARAGGTAAEIVTAANAALCEENGEAMFVTLAFAIVDARTGAAEIASAGHEEIYVVSRTGRIGKVAPMGPALGLFERGRFGSLQVQLDRGDWIVFATDGVTEAFSASGEVFGNDRLEARLAELAGTGPGELIAGVSATITDFAQGVPQSDDLTGLALQFCGSAADEGQPVAVA